MMCCISDDKFHGTNSVNIIIIVFKSIFLFF
jgi:hypothetical protein